MAFTPSQRMGPPPGASPPMRIAASWSRPTRGLPNTSVLGCSPMARSPRIVNPARTHPSLPLTSPTMRLDNSCPIQVCPWHEQGAAKHCAIAPGPPLAGVTKKEEVGETIVCLVPLRVAASDRREPVLGHTHAKSAFISVAQGMTIPATGRLGYWRTLPISGSSGMTRKAIAACGNAGSVLPISCRRSSIRTDGSCGTFGETMAKNVSGSTAASPDGCS